MPIQGNLQTTAMAVMPHTDADKALKIALSMDIPFWPQLPNMNYYEDMYTQASEHFPGILLDLDNRSLRFSLDKFIEELDEAMAHFEEPEYFDISATYSAVYHKFLSMDLSSCSAIRGQLEGPISFGFNILDQNDRPILFDETIRAFMMDFMARKINAQLNKLKNINPNAFMFIDEPGLQFIFNAMSGYDNITAFKDLEAFFSQIDSPRGIHLCGNPDWDFLLGLDIDILSLDVYTNGEIFTSYIPSIKKFLNKGGTLVWGITPTNFEPFEKENLASLQKRLIDMWNLLISKGIDRDFLLSRSLISPATCCLINPDREKTVEKAFNEVRLLSMRLRELYKL